MPLIIDNFFNDGPAVRAHALAASFSDFHGQDGQTYKRVAVCEVPGLREGIEKVFGEVEMLGMAYRLNFGGELPNQAVHSDIGWGSHAAVVYLCAGHGGTAFWEHRWTKKRRCDPTDHDLLPMFQTDCNNVENWNVVSVAAHKFNRAVMYESALFHSRSPFAAFGTGPDDGRLIAVAFFTPKELPHDPTRA